MNPRDINYGSTFNWFFNSNEDNGEESRKRSNDKTSGENKSIRKQGFQVHTKKHVVSSEQLAKKLYCEYGIKPGFQEHVEVPLEKFIEVLSDEIKDRQSRDKKIRHENSSVAAQRSKNIRGDAGSSSVPWTKTARDYDKNTKPFENATTQNTQGRMSNKEKVRTENLVHRRGTRKNQNSSFAAEIQKKTELTKNFVTSQISKVKDLFSFADTPSKVQRNRKLSSRNRYKNSLHSIPELKEIPSSANRYLQTRTQNVSNGNFSQNNLMSREKGPNKQQTQQDDGKIHQIILSGSSNKTQGLKLKCGDNYQNSRNSLLNSVHVCKEMSSARTCSNFNRTLENNLNGNKRKKKSTSSRDACKINEINSYTGSKDNRQDRSTTREKCKDINSFEGRISHCPEPLLGNHQLSKEDHSNKTWKNNLCSVANGSNSTKVLNSEKRSGDNQKPKISPQTSDHHISPESLVIDLCHGLERINVLPGSAIKSDRFPSNLRKKYQRTGTFLLASDVSTGSMFRLDIPDKLFKAKDSEPFDSKQGLLSFIVQVLNEPGTDFVPFPTKSADFWTSRLNGMNGKHPHLHNSTTDSPEVEQQTRKTFVNKGTVSTIFINETYSDDGKIKKNRVDTPRSKNDEEVNHYITESQTNCPLISTESTDTSSSGSHLSNNVQIAEMNTSSELLNVSCNELHCLHYKFKGGDIDVCKMEPESSCSFGLGEEISKETIASDSHRPVTINCSSSSKVRYRMYYQTPGARSLGRNIRIENGRCGQKKKKVPTIKKRTSKQMMKMHCKIKIKEPLNLNNSTQHQKQSDAKKANKRNLLSMSYPLAFDNKSNIFTFKEQPSSPLYRHTSSEEFSCPLYFKSSSENLVQASESVCSWSSHDRSHTDIPCVEEELVGLQRSASQSSWKTDVEETSKAKQRIPSRDKDKRNSRETGKMTRELQSLSEHDRTVIGCESSGIQKDQTDTNAKIWTQDGVCNKIVLDQRSSSCSSDVASRNKFGYEIENRVDLIEKSRKVLNDLARFSPALQLIARDPLLGDVILLTYATIFNK